MGQYQSPLPLRPRQGDLYEKLIYTIFENGTALEIKHSFWFVLTQDCDLTHHYGFKDKLSGEDDNHDKIIDTVLLTPAFIADQVNEGKHMANREMTMQSMGNKKKTKWKSITQNNDPRFHYFKEESSDFKIPELIIDFKRIYTFSIDYLELNEGKKLCCLDTLHAVDLTNRYTSFLSRVPLPDDE